jgi:4-hydroxybenzoate polyprenyltransferase
MSALQPTLAGSSTLPTLARALIVTLRPRQWTKNGLVLIPLAFALDLQQPQHVARALATCVLFCGLSSAGYLLNDVLDVETDRRHPAKRLRPIAAGLVPVPVALGLAAGLAIAAVLGCLAIRPRLGLIALAYLASISAYTLRFKHVLLLDVLCIAAGFVMRAASGALAIDVPISPWLYLATLLGALLLGLGKRRTELWELGEAAAAHRPNLATYTAPLLDHLILIVSSAALMTYALYTFAAENLPKNHSMMLTIPVVLYGLFRYLFLLHKQASAGASPEDLLFEDRPLLGAVALWLVVAVLVMYADSSSVLHAAREWYEEQPLPSSWLTLVGGWRDVLVASLGGA